ncbi:Eco57I restriction-modification methylase domain-containing protein [uncultured Desulfosarcina sp.]|uniref:Eco57I restriction-modification methylase domain-containing protein n=1 Tax=uncultured Desulfosarcina sp. TaxID=218289 RepID=UPI0029C90608|nr:TaqI-like C-terminal specificity domain-containing protein [uncultured Desulfosarcina sp.]
MADLTRAFNRSFSNHPVVILFRYRSNGRDMASLATCERSVYKQTWREGEKPGRISLLRNIDLARPHAGHHRILNDLRIERKGRNAVRSFRALYDQWRAVFDTDVLSEKFYKELFDWFLWACRNVVFPGAPVPKNEKSDSAYNEALQAHNSKNVIRLVIRLLFTWFLKEKGLVASELFDRREVYNLLKPNGDDSKYYKAILQNLFFATFNQEVGKREFRKLNGNRSHHYNVTNLYRYERLFRDSNEFMRLQSQSPFLNCGLFECQDKPDPTRKTRQGNPMVIRVDGFSDHVQNPLEVPEELFWGDEKEVDLHKEYGEKKAKFCTVRGLIPLLHAYKFTIDENTPLEQDIALDPELLGKVFENLLAAYNPETKTTARKQTGSFYTPREIVDYMVVESLVAYLERIVFKTDERKTSRENTEKDESQARLADIRKQLQILLGDTGRQPFDNATEKLAIIEALSRVKILDPACGSGAFPMGVLHCVVRALKKLDPDNEQWRKTQIKIAMEEVEGALRIEDRTEREKRLKTVSDSFEREASDYTRKLYLIENCIFGVDIQPIAVEISRMRFFISLMVDQAKNDDPSNNLGIKPLPNLETKFVAADTLIGLKGQQQLKSNATREIEKELEEIRHRHFNAKTWKTKTKHRDKDRELRKELEKHLCEDGWEAGSARKVAGWDPYDQNASSEFFDAEWMFGEKDGFDIVIGNPPYVRQEKIKQLKPKLKAQYPRFTSTADLYVYFFDQSLELLKLGGVLCFITSNKYFRAAYGKKLRGHLSRFTRIRQVIDFGDAPVFTSIAYPCIIITEKDFPPIGSEMMAMNWTSGLPIRSFADVFNNERFALAQEELKTDAWRLEIPEILAIMKKLNSAGTTLSQHITNRLYRGIITGLNEAFIIDNKIRNRLIAEDPSCDKIIKPFLKGRDIKRWRVVFSEQYLIKIESSENVAHPWTGLSAKEAEIVFEKAYPSIFKWFGLYRDRLISRYDQGQYYWELRACKYWKDFLKPKILYPDIYDHQSYAFDYKGYFCANTCYFIPEDNKYLCALLNSTLIEWFYRRLSNSIRGGYLRSFSVYMEQLPIVRCNSILLKEKIEKLVGKLIDKNGLGVIPIEAELDARIAALYGLTKDEYSIIIGDSGQPEPFRVAALNFFEDIQREGSHGPAA